MRILVAFDEAYRAYAEVIAAAICNRRRAQRNFLTADVGVETSVGGGTLEEVVSRFEPDLVICDTPIEAGETPIASTRRAWIELSVDPKWPSRIRLGEQSWETLNPSLEELFSVVELLCVGEEAHKLASSYVEESPKGWERYMEAERNALLDRCYGRLARALGKAQEGEDQEEIERIADEDRRLAEEGLVRVMEENGEISHKHLEQLTPRDVARRIRAERAMLDWLIARTQERSSLT